MKTAYNLFCDPGHSWLAVPIKDLFELGLTVEDFTPYSYRSRSGSTAYLEEDCDASKFWEVFKAKRSVAPAYIEKHTNARHWIRSMPGLKE
jgi:hypothetical protein